MVTLEHSNVQLGGDVSGKEEAIRTVGNLLVNSQTIKAGYIDSMFAREEVANTYLGNGIAIPHGLPKDRELINKTGIAVVQVPDGLQWNDGQTVKLVVGIAAKSDEHLDILRRLTRVLGDKQLVEKLTTTEDPTDIIEALTGERPETPLPSQDKDDFEHSFEAVVHNRTGLHARPATAFVDLARQFDADVRVRHGDQVADGKSMLSLLQLGIGSGATIRVSASGADAEAALAALKAGIESGLEEEEEEDINDPAVGGSHSWTPQSVSRTIDGISAANGIVIGIIQQYTSKEIVVEDVAGDRFEEANKLQAALDSSHEELTELYEEVKRRLGAGKAAIFRAHAEFLNDAAIMQDTISKIFDGHSAAWAWKQAVDERVAHMEKLDDPVLAGRAIDLSDVGQRVLRNLVGEHDSAAASPDSPVILIAHDLTPSDTATLDPDTILGFCTASGGPTSHTAIVAKSIGIPAVVAAGESVLEIENGTKCILDGFNGKLYLNPSEVDIKGAADVQREMQAEEDTAKAARFEPATTTDGHHIEVAANINRASAVSQALDSGAEGVGLMRTEFLFLERDSAPSEEEQFEAYRDMAQALDGRPLIIRTLDIGGDKEVSYLNLPKEDNSFLGVRGIRLCLVRSDLFIPQLKAIYRASAYGSIRMMFPMISTLEDLDKAREMAETVRKEVGAEPIDIGIMIEVPSAAILADQFAKEVAFFSIGTNDLTQYVLAMDRLHPQLAKQADGLHPAVLRMIDRTVQAASAEGKWVGVCGGMASDTKGAVILAGLGVAELSVSVPSIPTVKAAIREMSMAQAQALAKKALACRTATEVRGLSL